MLSIVRSVFISLIVSLFAINISAQQAPGSIKPGPSGIFILPGKEIPNRIKLTSYIVERSTDDKNWKKIGEISLPATFEKFSKAVDASAKFFPSQPLPVRDKLSAIYLKASKAESLDSLKTFKIQLPVRMALGLLYYDTTANQHIAYKYRVTYNHLGIASQMLQSDTVSLPFTAQFDSIKYYESSFSGNLLQIKWFSTGKNMAPLCMAYKFRSGAATMAKGRISQYSVNDTTFYSYNDTLKPGEKGKELQFFISPYDLLGNAGKASQIAVISADNFNRGEFMSNHASFNPDTYTIEVCWHFSDPATVKSVEIFRAESSGKGFTKIGNALPADTVFYDNTLWPEKAYLYYILVRAKSGKRTQRSGTLTARVPALIMPPQLKTPEIKNIDASCKGIRILIEVHDTLASHVRIYRGISGGLVSLANPVAVSGNRFVIFTDASYVKKDMANYVYAIRNELNSNAISNLSQAFAPDTLHSNPDSVVVCTSVTGNLLLWPDNLCNDGKTNSYTILRKTGAAGSKAPSQVIAENLKEANYFDNTSTSQNRYTYTIQFIDNHGKKHRQISYTTP